MELKMTPQLKEIINMALQEDMASKDITSTLLFSSTQISTARILAKEGGILCGTLAAQLVFLEADPQSKIKLNKKDGDSIKPQDSILTIQGNVQKLLACERTALNFLQHLSGVATVTSKFVKAVRGTGAKIFDTRKTIPGLRVLQKWAVLCGGGNNHRMHLAQMAMVKDNHLKMSEREPQKLLSLHSQLPKETSLVIEAKSLKEVTLALNARADIILLDNMPLPLLKKAIAVIRSQKKAPQIEVSGGITLRTIRPIAQLGVDRISIGRLTHSAPALDISMDFL